MRRIYLALDLLLIFLFTAVLIKPLFRAKYLNRWDSIESTFIADGRFLKEHWPHPLWQPLWYCGTRYDYIYPPVLRYGTALLSRVFIPVKAYHVYTALLYCLGIAGVYFMVRVMSGSRGAAWLAAVGAALVSPVSLAIPWRSPHRAPWHLWVLLGTGEGPHMSSLALLPFALAFAWLALRKRRTVFVAAAAIWCALVALTNFYGAAALAILYPILVWSLWVAHRDNRVWLRAAAIPALAYGLSAFWLTPSYVRITIENLRYVSSPGNTLSVVLFAVAIVLFAALSLRGASGKPEQAYAVFLCGSALCLGLNVAGHFHNFRVIGEAHRLAAELDLAMIMACVEVLRRLWNWPATAPSRVLVARSLAAMVVLFALWGARHYVRHAWELYPTDSDYQERVEYRMSDWMAGHLPQARTEVSGSIRFWWDTWHDLAQVGGGSEQGLLDQSLPDAQWAVMTGSDTEPSVNWLKAVGADAVIVPDLHSQEMYHDFVHPYKFAGVLPVLYDDHRGNVIYQVPRRYPSLARVVDRARLHGLQPLWPHWNVAALQAYTAVVEQGPDAPTTTAWQGTDAMRVHARVEQGQSVLVQVTYDPAWHAYLNGKPLPVHPDALDFSAIDAPPGDDEIALVFEMPLENRIGWAIALLSLAIAVSVSAFDYIHRKAAQ